MHHTRRYFLTLICAMLTMVVFYIGSALADGRKISTNQAYALSSMGEMLLVDIRSPKEWHETGVPMGAKEISMHLPHFPAKLLAAMGGDKNRKIGIICASGGRSSSIMPALKKIGFTNVYNVSEGIFGSADGPGWIKNKLPMDKFDE